MSPPLLPDAAARQRAATDFGRNLVVVAGAGTGKTSLLVERALTALGSGAVEINGMAAITFTEKAAGEMRRRLAAGLGRLWSLASGEAVAEGRETEAHRALGHLRKDGRELPEIAARTLAALQRLDRARITTIHTFCAELLREHPVEGRVQPDFAVDEGEHAEQIFEAQWGGFLRREMADDAPRETLWRALLARMPLARVRGFARIVAGFRIPPGLVERAARPVDARQVLGERVRCLVREMGDILDQQIGMSAIPLAFMEAARRTLEAFCSDGIDGLRRQRESEGAPLRRDKRPDLTKKLTGVDVAHCKQVITTAHDLIKGLADVDETLLPQLVEAVLPFAQAFREEILSRGFVTFDGLLVLARDLLRDHPEVRERLKRRFRFLLLDEFQDTDPLQYEIVLFLAEVEGSGATEAYAAELAPGRLFVVGDPKQSIYRFRGADYGAFVRAVERIAPDAGDRLHLTASFRSLPGVLGPINALFGTAEAGEWIPSDYQPPYEAIHAVREAASTAPGVEVWTIDTGDDAGAEARRRAEGRAIAAAIAAMVDRGECAYGDVHIILRAFTQLPLYVRPLRKLGIPFVVDGGKELLDRTEVMQFLAALRTLALPADPVALLAFLRSPAAGAPDAELAAYGATPGHWDWRNRVDPGRFPAIARAFDLLRRLQDETASMPADAAVRHVLRETHLLPLGAYGYEGAQRVANLRKIAGAAGELARAGRLTLNEILDALEKERVADREGESPLADETWQAVRVLTAHSAKGLENKIVFVPDLLREPPRAGAFDKDVEADTLRPSEGIEALAVKVDRVKNAERFWFEEERKHHTHAEEVRTLYVALTRARDRLFLLAGVPRGRAPWLAPLAAWGYDPKQPPADGASLAPGVLHRVIRPGRLEEVAARELSGGAGEAVQAFRSAVAGLRRSARPPFRRPTGLSEDEEGRRDAAGIVGARMSRARGHARAVGRVAHRLLEMWDLQDLDSLIAPLPALARRTADEDDVDARSVEAEVRGLMESFVASPLAGRLRGVKILGREVPMLWRDEAGATWRGNIDLLYEADGAIVVADFKTDPDESGAVDRHGGQLAAYSEAVRRACNLPAVPRAELWMLRSGRIVAAGAPPRVPTREAASPGSDAVVRLRD